MTASPRFSTESIRRRRIVLRALSACLPSAQVLAGLQYWEAHFGHETSLLTHIRRHVGELCDALGCPELRLQVYNQLFLAMVVDDRELPPDPFDPDAEHAPSPGGFDGSVTQPALGAAAAGAYTLTDGVKYAQTLSAFLLALRERQSAALGAAAAAFAEAIAREAERQALPPVQARLLQQLADGDMPLPFSVEIEHARTIVHLWYLALAQTVGPVEADRVFGQVLASADEIERMCGATPRVFL